MAFKNRYTFIYEPKPPTCGIPSETGPDGDHIRDSVSQIKRSLLYYMGIDIDQAGSSRDVKGNLRLFEVTPDGAITDPLESCQAVSGEFLEKIRQGRIFGFPAGEGNPIQLQLVRCRIKASRPVEGSPIPMPPSPNPWKRFANTVFGAYKKEIDGFMTEKARSERCRAALDEIRKRRRDILKDEEETYLAEEELRLGEKRDRKRRERIDARSAFGKTGRGTGGRLTDKDESEAAQEPGREDMRSVPRVHAET